MCQKISNWQKRRYSYVYNNATGSVTQEPYTYGRGGIVDFKKTVVYVNDYDYVEKDLKAVVDAAHEKNVIVKVIFENAYLTDEQKKKACEICTRVGADFTKTSTGYAPSGATIHDLKLMRANTAPNMQVKAAGGVRKLDDALMVKAVGGTRFGCTRTETMLADAREREKAGTLVLPEVTDDMEFPAVLAAREGK